MTWSEWEALEGPPCDWVATLVGVVDRVVLSEVTLGISKESTRMHDSIFSPSIFSPPVHNSIFSPPAFPLSSFQAGFLGDPLALLIGVKYSSSSAGVCEQLWLLATLIVSLQLAASPFFRTIMVTCCVAADPAKRRK